MKSSKSLGSVSPLSRRVFSAQDGARQKVKIFPEPSGNKLSESVLKFFFTLSVARTATESLSS